MLNLKIKDPQFFRKRSTGSAIRTIDLETEPAPTIMATGLRSVSCDKYWIEEGEPTVRASDPAKPPYRVPSMEEIRKIKPNGFRAISLFAGAGGSSLGYRMAGFKMLWASEFVDAARQVYEANKMPYTVVDGRDVREVDPEEGNTPGGRDRFRGQRLSATGYAGDEGPARGREAVLASLRGVGLLALDEPALQVLEAADGIEPAGDRVIPFEDALAGDDALLLLRDEDRVDLPELNDRLRVAGRGLLAGESNRRVDRRVALPVQLGGNPLYAGVTPYCPGDRLWVRESLERANGEAVGYPADATWLPNTPWEWQRDKLPSIHMPRRLSRITLSVTGVRVQRLQDISIDDAYAEGVVDTGRRDGAPYSHCLIPGLPEAGMEHDPVPVFGNLWEHINGDGSWDANPWVVAVTFRPILANIDRVEALAA